MGKGCRDMAEALRDCMLQQPCMADGTKTLKQCLHDHKYSHECQARCIEGNRGATRRATVELLSLCLFVCVCRCSLQEYRVAYFECRRGQLDMRQRIRGPKGGMSKPQEQT